MKEITWENRNKIKEGDKIILAPKVIIRGESFCIVTKEYVIVEFVRWFSDDKESMVVSGIPSNFGYIIKTKTFMINVSPKIHNVFKIATLIEAKLISNNNY
jgi:hypothetical protein